MIRKVLSVGPLQCNCVILADEATREAVVVDPGDDADRILMALAADRLRVAAILHTHAHIDHMGATAKLAQATGAPTYLHADDSLLHHLMPQQARMIGLANPEPVRIDRALGDGDVIKFGSHSMSVLHTPGHSPGSVSFVVDGERLCLSGDTLFDGGVGRTDLWGGDSAALANSIRARLYGLAGDVEVIPGARSRNHHRPRAPHQPVRARMPASAGMTTAEIARFCVIPAHEGVAKVVCVRSGRAQVVVEPARGA